MKRAIDYLAGLDYRRFLPALVILLLMAVTVGHVASYTGRYEQPGYEWLGWPYAIAVDLAIVVCSIFTRWATTRRWSWIGYFSFTAASGALNVAHVDPAGRNSAWAAWVYALFPTLAISLLGFLLRQVDQLSSMAERRKQRKASQDSEPRAKPEPALRCWCGKAAGSQNALNAHSRIHLREVREAANVTEARALLEAEYPDASLPGMADLAKMWRKATE